MLIIFYLFFSLFLIKYCRRCHASSCSQCVYIAVHECMEKENITKEEEEDEEEEDTG